MCAKEWIPPEEAPLQVMGVNDFSPEDSLEAKVQKMAENRFAITIHNLDWLRRQRNISQSHMCNVELHGYPKSSQISAFRNLRQEIPFPTIIRFGLAFGYTPEQMTGQLLDAHSEAAHVSTRLEAELEKYVGHYFVAYFHTDANLGENSRSTARALSYGLLTIYRDGQSLKPSLRAVAFFNTTEAACCKLRTSLENSSSGTMRQVYTQAAAVQTSGRSTNKKYLYEGTLELRDRIVEIKLEQVYGGKTAHLCLHNQAANSSDGSVYRGGLATLCSISRGQEHMPSVQAAILSRQGFSHVAKEVIANHLIFQPPHIELHQEVQDIIHYIKMLFCGETTRQINELSEADSIYLLESYIKKKLQDVIKRNVVGYYKVSTEMDAAVYRTICR